MRPSSLRQSGREPQESPYRRHSRLLSQGEASCALQIEHGEIDPRMHFRQRLTYCAPGTQVCFAKFGCEMDDAIMSSLSEAPDVGAVLRCLTTIAKTIKPQYVGDRGCCSRGADAFIPMCAMYGLPLCALTFPSSFSPPLKVSQGAPCD